MAKNTQAPLPSFNPAYTYPAEDGVYEVHIGGEATTTTAKFSEGRWYKVKGKGFEKKPIFHRTYVFWKETRSMAAANTLKDEELKATPQGGIEPYTFEWNKDGKGIVLDSAVIEAPSDLPTVLNTIINCMPVTKPEIRRITANFQFAFFTTAEDEGLSEPELAKAILRNLQARLQAGNLQQFVGIDSAILAQ
jgi:hypothetical protein